MCVVLLGASSVIHIVWDDQMPATIVIRLVAGSAHGLVYYTVLVHAGEIAVADHRGRLLSLVNISLLLGAVSFSIINATIVTNLYISTDRVMGCVTLVLAAVALVKIPCNTYESIPFLLRNNNTHKAMQNLMLLQTERLETVGIHRDLQSWKLMVNQDAIESRNPFTEGNWRPKLLMIAVRANSFLCNNWMLNIIQINLSASILEPFVSIQFIPLILVGSRLGASLVSAPLSDCMPRRVMLLTSGIATCAVTLVSAIMLVVAETVSSQEGAYALLSFFILHQIMSGFGLEPVQHILVCEAFSLTKKQWSLAAVNALEYAMHIVVLIIFRTVGMSLALVQGYVFVASIGIGIMSITLFFTLPETVGLSLRQCRDEFNRVAKLRNGSTTFTTRSR